MVRFAVHDMQGATKVGEFRRWTLGISLSTATSRRHCNHFNAIVMILRIDEGQLNCGIRLDVALGALSLLTPQVSFTDLQPHGKWIRYTTTARS
jgi:hypothetical protein